MITYTGSRRSGKTANAIIMAHSTKSILLVPKLGMVKCIEKQAKEMGYPSVQVMSLPEFTHAVKNRDEKERVVIDELGWFLRELIGVDVIMATITGASLSSIGLDYEMPYEHGGNIHDNPELLEVQS